MYKRFESSDKQRNGEAFFPVCVCVYVGGGGLVTCSDLLWGRREGAEETSLESIYLF